MPFLILLFLEKTTLPQKWSLSLLAAGLLIMIFGFDASLQLRLLAPVLPQTAFINGFEESLTNEGLYLLRSLGATIFASAGLFLSAKLLISNERTKSESHS